MFEPPPAFWGGKDTFFFEDKTPPTRAYARDPPVNGSLPPLLVPVNGSLPVGSLRARAYEGVSIVSRVRRARTSLTPLSVAGLYTEQEYTGFFEKFLPWILRQKKTISRKLEFSLFRYTNVLFS